MFVLVITVCVFAIVPSVTSQGALYTRWGRMECGLQTDKLIYVGVTAGSKGSNSGVAANTLCLPEDPEWGSFNDNSNTGASIFGAEYKTGNFNPFSNGNLNNENAPCVVCKSTVYTTTLMIPAKLSCHSGSEKAYSGYLMAEASGNHRTEYVCVDGNPEVEPAGSAGQDATHFYPVEGKCGSLPCPPYVNNRELTCVVCLE